MIDAYEIGIQLLLQEDVSAGLEVINRGLADVDRAIAATSAALAGLGNEAATASKAVAAAAGGRATPTTTSGQKTPDISEQVAQDKAQGEASTTSAGTSAEKAAAPELRAVGPTAPTNSEDHRANEADPLPQGNAPAQPAVSSAPVRSTVNEIERSNQRESDVQSALGAAVSGAPAKVASQAPLSETTPAVATVAPDFRDPGPPTFREVPPVGREPRQSATPPATQVAFTASVNPAQRLAPNAGQPERRNQSNNVGATAQRERPVAPWSGVDQSGPQAVRTRLREKAAAPPAAGRNQNESAGGIVMLDGRLVGQWLSEHMAREASRPPSGTSFFDPRQTPAWNVSGSL